MMELVFVAAINTPVTSAYGRLLRSRADLRRSVKVEGTESNSMHPARSKRTGQPYKRVLMITLAVENDCWSRHCMLAQERINQERCKD